MSSWNVDTFCVLVALLRVVFEAEKISLRFSSEVFDRRKY